MSKNEPNQEVGRRINEAADNAAVVLSVPEDTVD
jgi:hypothetical protein